MRILIRAFTLKRDVLAAQILAELFQRKRWSTAVVSVKDFPARLKLWRPDVVVVNTVGVIRYVEDIHPTAFLVFF